MQRISNRISSTPSIQFWFWNKSLELFFIIWLSLLLLSWGNHKNSENIFHGISSKFWPKIDWLSESILNLVSVHKMGNVLTLFIIYVTCHGKKTLQEEQANSSASRCESSIDTSRTCDVYYFSGNRLINWK